MKLNTLFLILFILLSIKTESVFDSFSIVAFKEYVKEKGLFKLIESIKKAYGQDVAIISCEELNKNCKGNCKKLVTEYMGPPDVSIPTNPSKPHESSVHQIHIEKPSQQIVHSTSKKAPGKPHKPAEENLKCINSKYYSKIIKHSYPNSDIKKKLRNFTQNQSNIIYNKIIKRVKALGPCKE